MENNDHPLLVLLETATNLESIGRYEKAAIAYERIITSPITVTVKGLKETAQDGLQRVKNKLSPPTPIPTKEVSLKSNVVIQEVVSNDNIPKNLLGTIEIEKLIPLETIEKAIPIDTVDLERMKDSIRTRGIQQPLLINKKGEIICGHTRYRIALELGIKRVPVIIKDIPDSLLFEYAIRDNIDRRQLKSTTLATLIASIGMKKGRGRRKSGDTSLTSDEVAEKLGVTQDVVDQAKRYARKLKEDPTLKGQSIRSVIEKKHDKYIDKVVFHMGKDDNNMEDKIMEKVGQLVDIATEVGDILIVKIEVTHKKKKG
jgi:ParB/RepB/Spo0J family partition protein